MLLHLLRSYPWFFLIVAIVVWRYWPTIKAAASGQKALATPSAAGEFTAFEQLLAERDRLQAAVNQAVSRAKALVDKELPKS